MPVTVTDAKGTEMIKKNSVTEKFIISFEQRNEISLFSEKWVRSREKHKQVIATQSAKWQSQALEELSV